MKYFQLLILTLCLLMSSSASYGWGVVGMSGGVASVAAYVGATNPSDDSWVAGVLALDASYMTSATNGSTPTWIEGSTPTPHTSVNVNLYNAVVK